METLVVCSDVELQLSALEIVFEYARDEKLRLHFGRDKGFCLLLLNVLRYFYGALGQRHADVNTGGGMNKSNTGG